jgi:HK97 family phage prohead protease
MDVKHLDFNAEIKTVSDKGSKKTFEAYASTFGNMDHHDDVIMKGAFIESLKKRNPKLAYQHDVTKLVGVITAAEEDDKGLLVRGEFLDTARS